MSSKLTFVAILLLAAIWRFTDLTYAIDEPCLTVQAEYWLYDAPAYSSFYDWDIVHPEDETRTVPLPRMSAQVWLAWRVIGALAGVLTVALTLTFARENQSNWGWAAALFVASAPWFISADRWVTPFDMAALAVSLGSVAILRLRRHPSSRLWRVVRIVSAASLLIIAPPLWWVALGLLLLPPVPSWRAVAFTLLMGVVSIPALQSPYFWLTAAQQWDIGATAACIWIGLALALRQWPRTPPVARLGLVGAVLISGGMTFLQSRQLPTPTAEEWTLVRWLQDRVPDGSRVRFDAATWFLAPVVACPVEANIQFEVQPPPAWFAFLPGFREEPPAPTFIVATDSQTLDETSYTYTFDGPFYVARLIDLPNPVDIGFGDQFFLLSYTVQNDLMVDVRLDLQYSDAVSVDTLAYGLFVHITLPGQPDQKIANFGAAFVEEGGNLGPRRLLLNRHFRYNLPPDTPSGRYDVVVGFFNYYTGERLSWYGGDALVIGQIEVE